MILTSKRHQHPFSGGRQVGSTSQPLVLSAGDDHRSESGYKGYLNRFFDGGSRAQIEASRLQQSGE